MRVYHQISELSSLANSIVTIGTFDGVHLGHQKIIKRLIELKTKQGGETVLFTFDPHPRKILFPEQTDLKLITTTEEKCELLKQFGIDHVLIFPFTKAFSEMQAKDYISDIISQGLKTKTLVIGYDHRFGSNREGNIETLKELSSTYQFEVEEIPAQEVNQLNISSTRIRKAIEEGNVQTANEYLGYYFFISGVVIKGKQLGRSLGYPTANIFIENIDKLIPKIGVYAVNVIIGYATYKGMLNIGTNPTTDVDKLIKIEVNIFDFDREIYGERIKIEFVKRIRDEEKFANLEELKQALANDKKSCCHE
ncbi:MAG: bifunctional riboflavin kinase/FAD synthetase [Burkholderiales bacterium]|nr:bifunctional riboflavin kinase/FAD synthetase [Bacteroidia bacterium]